MEPLPATLVRDARGPRPRPAVREAEGAPRGSRGGRGRGGAAVRTGVHTSRGPPRSGSSAKRGDTCGGGRAWWPGQWRGVRRGIRRWRLVSLTEKTVSPVEATLRKGLVGSTSLTIGKENLKQKIKEVS